MRDNKKGDRKIASSSNFNATQKNFTPKFADWNFAFNRPVFSELRCVEHEQN